MIRYECKGGTGCGTSGCEFIRKGQLNKIDLSMPYMCPWNHWRVGKFRKLADSPEETTEGSGG